MSPNTFELLQTIKTLYVHQVDSKCCMILIPRLERASLGEPTGNCESWNAEMRNGTWNGSNVISHRKLFRNDAGSYDQW